MTLFLVREHMEYDGTWIRHTCITIEHALAVAAELLTADSNMDRVSVLAISPGPGAGVEVARWARSYVHGDYPCDGEGPIVPGYSEWNRL